MNNLNKEEYEQINDIEEIPPLIKAEDLSNKEDRTLLYGYTCDRDSWHVYIKGGKIFTTLGTLSGHIHEIKPYSNSSYIPDKRLYPETCDFEFCKKLIQAGEHLPFTVWSDRKEKQYYGATK